MCMICDHYNANKLTVDEAIRNLDEMVRYGNVTEDHGIEIVSMILKREMETIENDLEMSLDDMFL